MYPLSSTSPKRPFGSWQKLCNQNEKWGRDMVRIFEVLTMSVSTSFSLSNHIPESWGGGGSPLPLPAFPSLMSVHHESLAMELLFNRSNKYIPNPLLSVGTYILGSLLCFFHECCWHIFCPWHDLHTYCMQQFDRETLLTKNKGQSATMWCLCCSLVLFWKQKNQRPFALKKAENEQIGLGQSGYIHIAHAGICPSICSPNTKLSRFCQSIQNQRTNEAMPRQNVMTTWVTRHFYEI
jgi:hypothetical protein